MRPTVTAGSSARFPSVVTAEPYAALRVPSAGDHPERLARGVSAARMPACLSRPPPHTQLNESVMNSVVDRHSYLSAPWATADQGQSNAIDGVLEQHG